MSAPAAPTQALAAAPTTSENKKRKIVVKPRDALVVENILSQMGANDAFEPRVVNQSLEFIYRYVGDVLEEARIFQRHRIGHNNDAGEDLDKDNVVNVGADGETNVNVEELKKRSVSVRDVRLASRVVLSREFAANDASAASAESLQKACAKLNEKPMPKLLERPGIRVPQDDNLLSDNYEIGPARGKEGEEQMRLALERDRKRKEAEEKERMEMLAQLQGGIAPTALTRGEGDGAGVQFNVRATKAIEVTTEKVKVDAKTKEAFEPEEEDYD
jgi:transcription initiation factor TFIID subunit 9B